ALGDRAVRRYGRAAGGDPRGDDGGSRRRLHPACRHSGGGDRRHRHPRGGRRRRRHERGPAEARRRFGPHTAAGHRRPGAGARALFASGCRRPAPRHPAIAGPRRGLAPLSVAGLGNIDISPAPREVVLEAGHADRHYWTDLWRYHELFQVLAWRDVTIRYKQTAIGVAWAVIRPLLATLIFSVLMGRVAKLPSDGGAPYPLMVFAGMLPWTFFAQALSEASNSLVANTNLVSKVYFPRLIVPTATIVA